MVLITRCCCWSSVRRGSFASAIFTLAVYLVLLTSAVFHVTSVLNSPELLTFSIFMLIFSFLCVVSSVMLLVGLCVDNRLLLLPWIATVSASTVLDFVLSFYLIPDMMENPIVGVLFATDIIICALNVYCILCVISQYQQYLTGRGRAGQRANAQPIPTVRLQPEISHSLNIPSVSYQVSKNGNISGGLLTVPSPNSSSMTSKSPIQTDMSSFSDEQSSNDISRKASTEDTSDDGNVQRERKKFFLSPFWGKSKAEEPQSVKPSQKNEQLAVPDIIIRVEDSSEDQKPTIQRFKF